MDMDLQSLQLKAISELLQLTCDDDMDYQKLKTWKVLIYDDETKRFLSPILKVGELRNLGVTLNMSIGEKREPIPGVDAVYLVTPKEENIAAILADAKSKKYKQLHINFTTYTTDEFLTDLAKRFVEANASSYIASVTDCYVHFASFALSTFSLQIPKCFKELYGLQADSCADVVLDMVVDRLFSVVVTMGSLPIIRAPKIISPATTVAEKLNKKLYDLINSRTQLGISLSGSFNRPVLVIMDRTVDLSSMIQHSWNYQPLLHDSFGINDDKVVLVTGDNAKRTTYDLESSDKIYQAIYRLPLSDVATHIASALDTYNSQIAKINKGDGEATGSLVNAMNAIPHLTEQKRLLDMHTNLATALVDMVKDRDIDRFYEFEYDLDLLSEKACFQHFEDLLGGEKSTVMDLYRALLLIALCRQNIPEVKLDELENRIKLRGDLKCEALKGLRNIMKMKAFSESLMSQIQHAKSVDLSTGKPVEGSNTASTEPPRREFSQHHKKLAEYSSKIIDTGVNIFKGVKRLLPRKKNTYVVNIVENLLNNSEAVAQEFAYYDPKTSENVIVPNAKRTAAKKCVVFIVGGGSFNESTLLQEMATRTKYSVLYGSTDFERPEDFVMQLGDSRFIS
ncbi:Sec1 like protein [Babesia gibsoni]|uniref:Sec1 like protein n=1 Tax=Babesia gibsoni TaxID=33632 RepID=A0AAD8PD05_BABGI|nr:Sec1 like protein [Babesia gibsoni]